MDGEDYVGNPKDANVENPVGTWENLGFDASSALWALQLPCSSRNFSTSIAAIQPLPAAVIA